MEVGFNELAVGRGQPAELEYVEDEQWERLERCQRATGGPKQPAGTAGISYVWKSSELNDVHVVVEWKELWSNTGAAGFDNAGYLWSRRRAPRENAFRSLESVTSVFN